MILHFGVIDLPYADKSGVTTGKVAQWLEDEYHIMWSFYLLHEDEIHADLTDAMQGAMESLVEGRPVPDDLFADGTSKIKKLFSIFLYTQEMDRLGVKGVPTAASLKRMSSRFKTKKAPVARPSFIDTGLYESSFIAWTEEPPAP